MFRKILLPLLLVGFIGIFAAGASAQKTTKTPRAGQRTDNARTTNSNQRRTKPVRNLDLDNGGMDTVDDSPVFDDPARKKNSAAANTQSNILPFIEQPALTKKPPTNTTRRAANQRRTRRTSSRPRPKRALDGKGTDVIVIEERRPQNLKTTRRVSKRKAN